MALLSVNKILNYVYIWRQNALELILGLWGTISIRVYSGVFIIFNLAAWVLAYRINMQASGDNIISLHYNVDFGVNLIGDASQVYIMPLLGLIIFLFNLSLLAGFYKKNKFITHLLLASAILVNIAIIISLDLINLINFR